MATHDNRRSAPVRPGGKARGDAAEARALQYLQAHGLRLVQRNVRSPGKNDPAIYAALKPSVDAAVVNAKPLNELTMEELRGVAAAGAGHHRGHRHGAICGAGQGSRGRSAGVFLGADARRPRLERAATQGHTAAAHRPGTGDRFRSNVWNIGAEGQFIIGAVFASGTALALAGAAWPCRGWLPRP